VPRTTAGAVRATARRPTAGAHGIPATTRPSGRRPGDTAPYGANTSATIRACSAWWAAWYPSAELARSGRPT